MAVRPARDTHRYLSDTSDVATRLPQPIILIRGFGGLDVEDEKRVAYQGFNDGTVYPQKRGENYIYEGLVLRFLKSGWKYQDATNVVGYYRRPVVDFPTTLPPRLAAFPKHFFSGGKLVVDPGMALSLLERSPDPTRTLWVFRYYDLDDRRLSLYGEALTRLIEFIRALATIEGAVQPPKVNIIAHSMGGLIVREAIQAAYPKQGRSAATCINKVVTLGTPHQGISFQVLRQWLAFEAADELNHFSPEFQANKTQPTAFSNLSRFFPPHRLLTVVGTNYKSYGTKLASILNRLFAVDGEYGPTYNRSDGLVKQAFAQIPGCPRTFVHKCHGGEDSLVTSREAFEVASRFFCGNVRAKLRLVKAKVKRGLDWFGKSEIFFGVSIKPRKVDFDLFHQSKEAENCYGPFQTPDLSDSQLAFDWADSDRLIWEGWLDTSEVTSGDLVLRLEFYVGERDSFGIGFSDNVVFNKQYYVRALLGAQPKLFLHASEEFAKQGFVPNAKDVMQKAKNGWTFTIEDTGFEAVLGIELEVVDQVES